MSKKLLTAEEATKEMQQTYERITKEIPKEKEQRTDHLDDAQIRAIFEIASRLENLLEQYRILSHPDMGQIVELDECLINFRFEFPPTIQQRRASK